MHEWGVASEGKNWVPVMVEETYMSRGEKF
jgi:hypothetical protein